MCLADMYKTQHSKPSTETKSLYWGAVWLASIWLVEYYWDWTGMHSLISILRRDQEALLVFIGLVHRLIGKLSCLRQGKWYIQAIGIWAKMWWDSFT